MRATLLSAAVFVMSAALAGCRDAAPEASLTQLLAQANAFDQAGRQEDAIALYRSILGRAPDSYDAHYGLGRVLDLAGRYEEARQHFTKAIALADDGRKDQVLRMTAISWTFSGHIDEAARLYQQVFDRRLKDRNYGAAGEVGNELGRAYLEHGDLDRAAEWYRSAHTTALREADLPAWRVDLADMRLAHAEARIAARRGRAAEARAQQAIVRRLLDKGGNEDQEIQYRYLQGYVDFYLGRTRQAIPELDAADQKDPFILLLMAEAHDKLGETEVARDYYRRVMQSTSHAVNNAFARPVARAKLEGAG